MRAYFDMTMDLSAELTLKIYVTNAAGYATEPSDTPANQPFRGVLQSFSFSRSIMQSDIGQFTTVTRPLRYREPRTRSASCTTRSRSAS